jgi:transcriptional regulator with GAF, ATPase, and Fis domain
MFKRPADIPSAQRNFQEVHTLLMGATAGIAKLGAGGANLIRDLSRITQLLGDLEQGVVDQLKDRESQLGALMGIGRTINSSRGRRRVLEEVMDTLIVLMRAERGFLMLKGADGRLVVETARGIDQINLEAEDFKVSRTIVDRVAATGETILTTNAQEDPRFENQMSVAAYRLRSILCAPLMIKDALIGVIMWTTGPAQASFRNPIKTDLRVRGRGGGGDR